MCKIWALPDLAQVIPAPPYFWLKATPCQLRLRGSCFELRRRLPASFRVCSPRCDASQIARVICSSKRIFTPQRFR